MSVLDYTIMCWLGTFRSTTSGFSNVWCYIASLLDAVFKGIDELFSDFELSEGFNTTYCEAAPVLLTGFRVTGTVEGSSCKTCFRIAEDDRLTAKDVF